MKKEPIIVNVYLWGTCIGKLNWDFEKHCSVFQFTDEYRKQDYDICPSTHPKRTPLFASFYGNKDKLYQGLPEFLADALPDKWGASLFDQWLTDNNIKVTESLPLLKLSYIGKRAMGALEFEPEFNDDAIHESVNMSSLATLASKIYNDRDAAVISPEDSFANSRRISSFSDKLRFQCVYVRLSRKTFLPGPAANSAVNSSLPYSSDPNGCARSRFNRVGCPVECPISCRSVS